MLWALGLVVTLLSAPQGKAEEAPSGTLVLYADSAPLMVRTAEAIERLDRSARLVPAGEPWSPETPPRQIVALGETAARRARSQWPNTVRAEAFTWNPDRPDVSLTLIGRPEAACVVEVLRTQAPTQWLVLASPSDTGAESFAAALGADLVTGRERELQPKVRSLADGTGIWLRGHPDFNALPWLDSVAKVAGPDQFVGADVPGYARHGFATPVDLAPDRIATRLVEWMHQPRRRRQERRVEELPCSSK